MTATRMRWPGRGEPATRARPRDEPPCRRVHVLGAFMVLAVSSAVGLLDFCAANASRLESYERVVQYYAATLLLGVAYLAVLRVLLPRVPVWRLTLVVAAHAWLLYSYDEVKWLLGITGTSAGRLLAGLAAWVVALLAVAAAVLSAARHPRAVWGMAALAWLFVLPPLFGLLTSDRKAHALPAHGVAAVVGAPVEAPRNVYWVILDGYPRRDVLREMFGVDNGDFLAALEARGFTVLDGSHANYPGTIYSIASALQMDYVFTEDTPPDAVRDYASLYRIVRGDNRVVGTFREMGYAYVHFANGYDYLTLCGDAPDLCVVGSEGLDEKDVAILSNTPWIDVVSLVQRISARWQGEEGAPTFAWGAVDELTAKLPVIRRAPTPFFLYAHVIAPHPPMRLTADCRRRAADPDLRKWSLEGGGREAFGDQVRCVNDQVLQFVDAVVREDPAAIILLQADHGTAFRGQLTKKAADWDDDDVTERFATLSAMRLPADCRSLVHPGASLVNTFPVVLTCLGRVEVPRLRDRFFVVPYDDSPEFGLVVEYPPPRRGPSRRAAGR